MDAELLQLLCCPGDHTSPLDIAHDSLSCPTCGARFPIVDGIVVFLDVQQLSDEEEREKEFRSAESADYDDLYAGYTDAVESRRSCAGWDSRSDPCSTPAVEPAGSRRPSARSTSRSSPSTTATHACGGCCAAVRASGCWPCSQTSGRSRCAPGAMSAATCMEVHQHVRDGDRPRFVAELARVLAPGASLVISTFNYNLIFRAWRLLGNEGARRGEHVLGNDYPYRRFERDEFARELSADLQIRELTGIRNIPARSIAQAIRRLGARRAADRFQQYMTERGRRADHFLEWTAVAGAFGFFWLARAVKSGPIATVRTSPSGESHPARDLT